MATHTIENVSDTALWVAAYRATETERPDALFRDPLAARLVGERGQKIAKHMEKGRRYTAWAVVIRTCIIDDFITKLVSEKIDTVLNLGAGLDTRPYRMDLPASLRWIEVDFPHMIELKEERLQDQKPKCQLRRVKLDLSNREARTQLFTEIAAQSQNVLVLTEGVMPYLSLEQAASLADDLLAQKRFRFWIMDYFSPEIARFMQRKRLQRKLKNAPFRFFPKDWFGFFSEHGWKLKEIRHYTDESLKLGRPIPLPWWVRVIRPFLRRSKNLRIAAGYVMLEPSSHLG